MGIGNKLNELLKDRNMTVTELSRKINVAPTTIYSIIQRNNKKVDIDVLLDIADVLGVTAEYFRDSPKSEPTTRAAHFDGTEFTEEQLDRIEAFAKFIKQEDK
ncbi:helix-turn-helix transcriptional regulator [Drancourtella massiliensis]|uniref:Helix-turn-helix transcriptional regulator n=1 Tax=Drancourtella massiliensis TaxID=1632013 RepID=A0ABS2EJN2_9FIRM|nr:helix-turn-helix transcriptional regulator [Drancourtella massiliensis]MBM6745250.1 helix-turn-helix transcriptional regulator [Drancourtella massiliensis]